MVVGFLNSTKKVVHCPMDFCTWVNNFLDLNVCLLENNNYYSNLRLKEKSLGIDTGVVPILNFVNRNEFNKLFLKLNKEIIVCNISFNLIGDDSYDIFERITILFLIIETEEQLINANELKKELKCKIFYIFLSEQKIKHKHFLFYCNKFDDAGRTYFYKNYNQIFYSKILAKIEQLR